MKQNKIKAAKDSRELYKILNIPSNKSAEIELKCDLVFKINQIVNRKRLTHLEVAKLASTSRTRITAILNYNVHNTSIDLLTRVLFALGYRINFSLAKVNSTSKMAA